jgi:hypothetical protein
MIRRLLNILREVLREIFDENAYARYLARESRSGSAQAYFDFLVEKHRAPMKRCC